MTLGQPSGPLDAPCVLVGRDWGFEEVAAGGRPFVGAAGKVLDRALAKARLERGRCLITNVVNARPAGNKWEAHVPDNLRRGLDSLRATLGAHPRRLIVAMGAEAFQAARGRDPSERPEAEFDGNGITELRGYVFNGPFGPVLAATHPAFVLRTWLPWWPLLCWDLQKAKRYLDGVVGRGGSEVLDALPQPTGPLAVDIETSGAHAERISCIAFATSADIGYCVPFTEAWRPEVAELLASPVPKIFHNGQFDTTILERNGLTVKNWQEDSMILYHVLEPLIAGRSKEGSATQKSLRFLASLLTDEPFWKLYDFGSGEEQRRLCARDSRITFQVWQALSRRLEHGTVGT